MELDDGTVIDESLDIMLWTLNRHDPDGWLGPDSATLQDMLSLISTNDGDFKHHLDRTNEILGSRLNTIHNLFFYQELLRGARAAIKAGTYEAYKKSFYERRDAGVS